MLFLTACFPTRTAPKIKTYKLQKASKFSKGLPKDTGFIFKDSKEEGAFYTFIQEKFNLDDEEMEHSIAFDLNGKTKALRAVGLFWVGLGSAPVR